MMTKLLDQLTRKVEDGGRGNDVNGGCDGYRRVTHDSDKNLPSWETHAMPGRHLITVQSAEGLLSCHIEKNGGKRGGVND